MKHTTRMLLIPEDVYRSLMAAQQPTSSINNTGVSLPTVSSMDHAKKQVTEAATNNNNNSLMGMNDDERLIHYQQEFKRYKKLLTDEEERPAHVRLSALPESAKGVFRDALMEAAAAKQQLKTAAKQTTTTPTPVLKKPRRPKRPTPKKQHESSSEAPSFSSQTATEAEDEDEEKKMSSSTEELGGYMSADTSAHPHQHQQEHPSSSSTVFNRADAERRVQRTLEHVEQHPGHLNLGGADGMQVMRLTKGAYKPIRGSNLQEMLSYHFIGRHEEEGEGVGRKAPPGYATFLNNAKGDGQLSRLLFPERYASESSSSLGRRRRNTKMGGGGAAATMNSFKTQQQQISLQATTMVAAQEEDEKEEAERKKAHRERQLERMLDPLYKDARSSACFTRTEPLLREAARVHPRERITRAEVRRYLARQRVYTLHRQAVRRFRRLPTVASGLHTDWQADLADFRRLKAHNGGFAYLLVCIDCLSRQLFVQPGRSKRATDMVAAFQLLFRRSGYVPWRLLTDKGREFTARAVQHLFTEKDLRHHCMETSPLWHAGMAERAVRSIKERLYRYFTHRGTQRWTGVVQQLVNALNASPNSSIFGARPRDITFANAEALRRRLAKRAEKERSGRSYQRVRFRVGDWVRIERHRHVFRKGYLPRFTLEVFIVDRVCTARRPVTYKLRDAAGEPITGLFYAQDLCLVLPHDKYADTREEEDGAEKQQDDDDKVHGIEKILKRRHRKGEEQCFVKWSGISARYNSWIPASSII